MITNLLIFALLNSLAITGFWTAFLPDMVLGGIPKMLYKLSPYLKKPLFECLPCMASIWGGLLYIVAWKLGLAPPLYFMPIHILAVSGLNMLFLWLILLGQTTKEFNESYTEITNPQPDIWGKRSTAVLDIPIECQTKQGVRFVGVATKQAGKIGGIGFRDHCDTDIEVHWGIVVGWRHLSVFNEPNN